MEGFGTYGYIRQPKSFFFFIIKYTYRPRQILSAYATNIEIGNRRI